jgi:DNA-binding MarR family transcriptional regulator
MGAIIEIGEMTSMDAKTLGRSMLAVRQVMAREVMLSAVQALGQSDLTLLQFGCLMVLSDGAVRTVGEVSAALGRSMSATSRLLDQLVRRALISRAEDPQDRRSRHVTISAAGRRFLLSMMRRRAQAELRLLGHLTAEERPLALRGLELLRLAAERARHTKER